MDPTDGHGRQLAELMVGSELPVPETRESTVTDQVGARVRGRRRRCSGRRALPARATSTSRSTAGEVVGIAGVEGNGQAELVDVILGLRPGHRRHDRPRRRGHRRLSDPRAAGRPASATSPRTATGRGCSWLARSGRTRCSGTRPRRPSPRAPGSTGAAPSAAHQEIVEQLRRADPERRRGRLRPLRRQPAEADRRPRDDRRSPVLLIASHPTRGVDVGAQAAVWDHLARRPGAGPGRPAGLGRPRGADRPVGHGCWSSAGPHRGRARPGHGHPRGARVVHDRRPQRRGGLTCSGSPIPAPAVAGPRRRAVLFALVVSGARAHGQRQHPSRPSA